MTGPGLAELVPFATAIIGAAAALTGLLFVAVSLNLSLALDLPGGPYWLVGTALLGIIGAVYNAWVLLIEIIR